MKAGSDSWLFDGQRKISLMDLILGSVLKKNPKHHTSIVRLTYSFSNPTPTSLNSEWRLEQEIQPVAPKLIHPISPFSLSADYTFLGFNSLARDSSLPKYLQMIFLFLNICPWFIHDQLVISISQSKLELFWLDARVTWYHFWTLTWWA